MAVLFKKCFCKFVELFSFYLIVIFFYNVFGSCGVVFDVSKVFQRLFGIPAFPGGTGLQGVCSVAPVYPLKAVWCGNGRSD
jgi:hypothetical protein